MTVPVEVQVEAEIKDEIARLREQQIKFDDAAQDLQPKYTAAAKKAEKSGDQADQAVADELHRKLMIAINAGTTISEKIQNLRHPSTLESRVQKKTTTTARITGLRERSNMSEKVPTPKEQGFPDVYLGENGKFKIGMDARAKSDLVASALGLITEDKPGDSKHVFTKAEAEKLLKARGWTGFLERKREILAEKEQKAKERATEREQAAKERAEAKEKAAKEKAAEKAAAKAAGTQTAGDLAGEATPHQKPTGRSRAKASK